jgi:DMSO/TMAO reductase YedYZ molybdopterin-dependent catalytic subunit
MGNARWRGVSLKSVLEAAGVKADAQQVTFNGMDKPVMGSTPDYRKALGIDHALSGEPMLAWDMNGEELPLLNGYPLKLIVPGYFATYWVKHLAEIEVIDHDFEGHDAYFMAKGYRMPDNACGCVEPGTNADKTRPVTTLTVRSFITSVMANEVLPLKQPVELKGIAFDGGAGIKSVAVSIDNGHSWQGTKLGEDLGRFSFREWRLPVTFTNKGT